MRHFKSLEKKCEVLILLSRLEIIVVSRGNTSMYIPIKSGNENILIETSNINSLMSKSRIKLWK